MKRSERSKWVKRRKLGGWCQRQIWRQLLRILHFTLRYKRILIREAMWPYIPFQRTILPASWNIGPGRQGQKQRGQLGSFHPAASWHTSKYRWGWRTDSRQPSAQQQWENSDEAHGRLQFSLTIIEKKNRGVSVWPKKHSLWHERGITITGPKRSSAGTLQNTTVYTVGTLWNKAL